MTDCVQSGIMDYQTRSHDLMHDGLMTFSTPDEFETLDAEIHDFDVQVR